MALTSTLLKRWLIAHVGPLHMLEQTTDRPFPDVRPTCGKLLILRITQLEKVPKIGHLLAYKRERQKSCLAGQELMAK